MLQVTVGAITRMRNGLSEEAEGDSQCFRIVVTESGVELIRDEARADDLAYTTPEGRVVLVVDADTAAFLKDRTIDYDEAESALVFA